MISLPIAAAIGAPLSTFIMQALDGVAGLPGWRWVFITEGVPAIALGLITLGVLRDKPAQVNWLAPAERQWLQAKIDREQQEDSGVHAHGWREVLGSLTDMRTLIITFTGVCFVIGFYGAGFWLPQIIKTFQVSTTQVGLLAAVPHILGAIAMLLWAHRGKGRAMRLSDVILPLLLACVSFVGASLTLQQPVWAMTFLCLAMVGLYACMPAYWTLPTLFFGGTAAAATLAFINAVSNLGGFFGPAIIGWLTQTTGSFQAAIATLGGFVVVGAVALLALLPAWQRRARTSVPV
jgi:ACS family tartrate transporter-like MFS transporter